MRRLCLGVLGFALLGCARRADPPGAASSGSASAEPETVAIESNAEDSEGGDAAAPRVEQGSMLDALPFEPGGKKIASIAWRTWVYTDVGDKRTRYGYLRAGAVVDAREPPIVNAGCAGGWYRVNPRGFVCVGKGASLDLDDPVAVASRGRAVRGQGLPYLYAMAGDTPPLRYFRLPTKDETRTVEGDGTLERAAQWRLSLGLKGVKELLGTPGAPPAFMTATKELPKAYGVPQHLHFAVHAGRTAADSGFAITQVIDHEGRWFGLTTELDLIALDRTRIIKPSSFHGTTLEPGEALPVAFVQSHFLQRYQSVDGGPPVGGVGNWQRREPVKLTGKTVHGGFLETRDGYLMPQGGGRIIPVRNNFPSFATGDRKWVDVSIQQQSLVAYEGTRPVYVTLVSTGRGGMGDPEKQMATIRGTFMVVSKHVSATMDGEDDVSDSYNLLDVPFVQYFHNGFALHGTYWHDDFGEVRSHGCINLAPIDAAWLFEWTDPNVPPDWHGVINKDRGTVVLVRQ
jgi:hypothetical protein